MKEMSRTYQNALDDYAKIYCVLEELASKLNQKRLQANAYANIDGNLIAKEKLKSIKREILTLQGDCSAAKLVFDRIREINDMFFRECHGLATVEKADVEYIEFCTSTVYKSVMDMIQEMGMNTESPNLGFKK